MLEEVKLNSHKEKGRERRLQATIVDVQIRHGWVNTSAQVLQSTAFSQSSFNLIIILKINPRGMHHRDEKVDHLKLNGSARRLDFEVLFKADMLKKYLDHKRVESIRSLK